MSLGPVVCDACVVLNLVATGQAPKLLRALGARVVMATKARGEARYLRGPAAASGRPTLVPADLRPLEAKGLVEVRALDGPFLAELVRCAELIKDSDAECLALAAVSGLPLATDDRKQRGLFAKLYGGSLLSTLEMLRDGARALKLPEKKTRELVGEIYLKGGFAPPRPGAGLPHAEWYREHLRALKLI